MFTWPTTDSKRNGKKWENTLSGEGGGMETLKEEKKGGIKNTKDDWRNIEKHIVLCLLNTYYIYVYVHTYINTFEEAIPHGMVIFHL